MPGENGKLQSALWSCEHAPRRVADYRLDLALDRRLRELREQKERLSKAEHDELLALVAFTQQRTLKKLEAEAALRDLHHALTCP
jgi:hypothetical protein